MLCGPLESLRNVKKFVITDNQRGAFQHLVRTINSAPVLSVPDYSEPFRVSNDASQYGVGAVLYQVVDGRIRYIMFSSKSLTSGQKNYPATKRELLAIVFALRQFHFYLYGRKFLLYTDHKALLAISTKAELSYVMANWLDVLLSYDFDIHHRPGSSMVLPDSLSRMYQFVPRARTCLDLKSTEEKQAEPVSVRRITVDELTKYPDRELAQLINDRLLKKHVARGSSNMYVWATQDHAVRSWY